MQQFEPFPANFSAEELEISMHVWEEGEILSLPGFCSQDYNSYNLSWRSNHSWGSHDFFRKYMYAVPGCTALEVVRISLSGNN